MTSSVSWHCIQLPARRQCVRQPLLPPNQPGLLKCPLLLTVATPAVPQVSVDRPFELTVGQEVAVADADLHLRFEHMLEDSRCPRQVTCFWAGQARLDVTIWGESTTPETKEFSTFSRPPKTTDTHTIQGFSIKLLTVEPYPDKPDQPIPADSYRATLLVTRSQ